MKLFKLFVSALFTVSSVAVIAQNPMSMKIPVDENVRVGKLANGLTYYIRHNGYPEKMANFYIAQRVGSINEDDNQRGLAHFLEHMAFNGSEHFKGNGIIEFTRSLGVEFGSDLNAYTGIDQTVYRVCDVPTKRTTALDSCLLILKDWSNGLLLEQSEIEKERDVIHNEWRLGEGPGQRMLTRALPRLYPNSKYGERMPIGLMSIVDSFRPQTLRAYYNKWYRPDNQAIIVVGDVDVNHIEAKIKELFGGIKVAKNAPKVIAEPVPDNNNAIYIIEKDKEQQYGQMLVMMKHEAVPDSVKSSLPYLFDSYMKSVVAQMLNARFAELAQEENCPFLQASADDGQYLLSSTKDAFEMAGICKEGQELKTLAALMREAKRAYNYGFTATEYERAKANYLSALESQYTNRNKIKNAQYGDDCRDHYLSNEPLVSIEVLYQLMNQVIPSIPVDLINQAVKELISTNDTNLVVMHFAQEKEGKVYPSEADLKSVVDASRSEQVSAYVDNVVTEPLIAKLPAKGKIKKETENKVLGYKELKLSNGATVILKKTDFKDNEVLMQAFARGGQSLFGSSDFANLKVFNEAISYSGLGNFSSTELQKALAGKNANADLSLGKTRQYLTAYSTPKDIETMFQMAYLYFTNIKKDEKQFNTLMNTLETTLKNRNLSPDMIFSDSLANTANCHNPRFANLQVEDLKNVNYDRILEMAQERYKNAGQFTFVILGNFDEDSIRPYIEQYIASLPATKAKPDQFKEIRTYAKGKVHNKFMVTTESPKATAIEIWNAYLPHTLENSVKLDAVSQILSMVYLKTIREEESAAYSVGAYSGFDLSGKEPLALLQAYCPMNPDKSDIAVRLLHEGIENASKAIDADMLAKVKESMIKSAAVNAKNNNYWMNMIVSYKDEGIDFHTDYVKTVEALTPATVQDFLKNKILSSGNLVEVIMLPSTNK